MSRLALQSILLDVTKAGDRLVTVGERGLVLFSDDKGKTWRQAVVPVSVSLTSVKFVTPNTGYAVGHFGIVIKSVDGGETWRKQLDGVTAANLLLEEAKRNLQESQGDEINVLKRKLALADLMVKDGPDKPFLDLYFETENAGFIVGAYNLIFRTEDGGKNWIPWQTRVENPRGMHLNGILKTDGKLYIAGEQGLFLRSDDDGQSFKSIPTPYHGSYFGVISPRKGQVLIYGLKGNAFITQDQGLNWKKMDTGVLTTITGAAILKGEIITMVTQAGEILVNNGSELTFHPLGPKVPTPLAGVIATNGDDLLVAGMKGIMRIGRETAIITHPKLAEGDTR